MIEHKQFRLKEPLSSQQAKQLTKLLGGRYFSTYSAGHRIYAEFGIQEVLTVYYYPSVKPSTRLAIELMFDPAV